MLFVALACLGGAAISSARVTNNAAENPLVRDAKQLGEALVTALNKDDFAGALALFDTNCLVTWCNAEISRGHEGLRAFRERLRGGALKRVESFECEIKFDDAVLAQANGAVVICSGGFNERFKPAGGRKIDLQGRWTATLSRHGDSWAIANLQLSTDPFNNSLLNLAKQAGWVVGVVSLLVGAGVGFFLGRRKAAG